MPGVIGAFHELDAAVQAIEELKKRRIGDVTVYTPTPRHEIEHAIQGKTSPVRLFTLFGGLVGATCGYWIAIWTSDYWALVVGGKPVASWVPYTIFGFEVMAPNSPTLCFRNNSVVRSGSGLPSFRQHSHPTSA